MNIPVKPEQEANANVLIAVTELGITNAPVKPVHDSNAPKSITFTFIPMLNEPTRKGDWCLRTYMYELR